MKRILLVAPVLMMILLTISCTHPEDKVVPNGGVVITFDDNHFTQWLQADSLLEKYEWKATFCISLIGSRSQSDIERMHKLQDAGHEIAGHGYIHVYSAVYTATHGIEKYIENEITPMMDFMENESINLRTFAYPYGNRNNYTDNNLLDYFDILRGISFNKSAPDKQKCYFDNTHVIYGVDMDSESDDPNEDYILSLLTYAHENGKILILYGHRSVETVTGKYQVSFHTLDMICHYVYEHEMEFYTMSDLADMIDF